MAETIETRARDEALDSANRLARRAGGTAMNKS
jgi:hypothetical protein